MIEMDNASKNNKYIFYVFLVLIIICNVIVGCFMIKINRQLEKHKQIQLTVPSDLENQVINAFQEAALEVRQKSLQEIKTAAEQIGTVSEKNLNLQKTELHTQLALLGNELTSIKTLVIDNTKALSSFVRERETRAHTYLEAARTSLSTPDVAQILYVSALAYSINKAPILHEFIDWQALVIKQALKKGGTALAQEKLMALVNICDVNISSGSIEDMTAIPAVKEKLVTIEKLISSQIDQRIMEQREQLLTFAERVGELTSYESAEKLLNSIDKFTCDSSLNDQKDTIIAKIISRQSCLTTPEQAIELPVINADTPWVAWLENFIRRLKSNIAITVKLADLEAAADFLLAAKQSKVSGVAEKVAELESISRQTYLNYWQERTDRTLNAKKQDLNDISSLLAECNMFSYEEQKANLDRIIKLNKCITAVTLVELTENLKQLKSTENMIPAEAYMQAVCAVQGQYLQMLLRLQEMQVKYPEYFSEEIVKVTKKITGLDQLISAYKSKLTREDLLKGGMQRKKFIAWVKEQFKLAEQCFEKGEKIAGQWNKTTRSIEAKEMYIEGWHAVMKIHPDDLHTADPALVRLYNEIKEKIEKRWKPTEYQMQRIEYKRISDF